MREQIYCSQECAHNTSRKFDITANELLLMFYEEPNYTKIAGRLGVSATSVKKRCKSLGIYETVNTLIALEKRNRAISNQRTQDKEFRQSVGLKTKDSIHRSMDYYVGYADIDGEEVELVRFDNTDQLRAAGYSVCVVRRVCLGKAKTYRGMVWRREPKSVD